MYPRTDRFDTAVRESHTVALAGELWLGNAQLIAKDLRIVGGAVNADRSAATLRSGSVDLVDPTGLLIPSTAAPAASPATPYGYEVRLWRGIDYIDGSAPELIPLGVFPISETDVEDAGAQSLSISIYDRSRKVSRARFLTPWVVQPGSSYVSTIQAMCDYALPYVVPKVVLTDDTTARTNTPIVYDEQANPWDAMTALANSIGCEIFFDRTGALVIQEQPDPLAAAVVWQYAEGDDAMLLKVAHTLSDEPGYNYWTVTGESSDNETTPFRGTAADNDPSSPTFIGGPYGLVPAWRNDPLVTSDSQAAKEAQTLLRAQLGLTETITFAALPHPAQDPADAVRLARVAAGVNTTVLIQAQGMPLDVKTAATYTTRARRDAS